MEAYQEYLALHQGNVADGDRQVEVVHQKALAYFNSLDQFVSDTSLLGAHSDVLWVTRLAEDCHSVLESVALHYTFLRGRLSEEEFGRFRPSATAYSAMQRMVARYLPGLTKTLEAALRRASVPTFGFDNPLPQRAEPAAADPTRQRLLVTFGVLLAVVLLVVVLFGAGVLRFGIEGQLAYVVYVITGLLAASLTFGLLASVGEVQGHAFGVTARFGGAAAVLVAVVAGGGVYEQFGRKAASLAVNLRFVRDANASELVPVGGVARFWVKGLPHEVVLNGSGSDVVQGVQSDCVGDAVSIDLNSPLYELVSVAPTVLTPEVPITVVVRSRPAFQEAASSDVDFRVLESFCETLAARPDVKVVVVKASVVSRSARTVPIGAEATLRVVSNTGVPVIEKTLTRTTDAGAVPPGAELVVFFEGLLTLDEVGFAQTGKDITLTIRYDSQRGSGSREWESDAFKLKLDN